MSSMGVMRTRIPDRHRHGRLKTVPCVCVSPSLSLCRLTETSCSLLASALRSSVLRELDLSYNHPCRRGTDLLSALVEDPSFHLQKLRYLGLRPEDGLNSLVSRDCQLLQED